MLEIELRNLSLGFGDRTLFSDARLSISRLSFFQAQ